MKVTESNAGKMETQLKQWGAKLDKLAAKAEEAGTETKADYRKRIEDLKAKHRVAQGKFDEIRASGSEKWEILKTGVEKAWNELESALKKMKKPA